MSLSFLCGLAALSYAFIIIAAAQRCYILQPHRIGCYGRVNRVLPAASQNIAGAALSGLRGAVTAYDMRKVR